MVESDFRLFLQQLPISLRPAVSWQELFDLGLFGTRLVEPVVA